MSVNNHFPQNFRNVIQYLPTYKKFTIGINKTFDLMNVSPFVIKSINDIFIKQPNLFIN